MGRQGEPGLVGLRRRHARGEGCRALKVLLEGRPGIGKTTVARKLAELLREREVPVSGFTTEEIRVRGRRVGFAIETLDGRRETLAHVNLPGPPRVSRYGVDVDALERLALPAIEGVSDEEIVVIDEIGKMELASGRFRHAVQQLFDSPIRIVATVQVARNPVTDSLKRMEGVELIRVNERNRGALPQQLAKQLAQVDDDGARSAR